MLESYSNSKDFWSVRIIVGPQDSGKSPGIVKAKENWQKAGHLVIDLNLKGQPLHVKTDKAMKLVTKDFLHQLQTLDDRSYASTLDLYKNAIINCADEYVPGITETLLE